MAGSLNNNSNSQPLDNNYWEALLPADLFKKEQLQQVKAIFNIGYRLTEGGAIIFLASALFSLSGKVPAVTATTVGGLASGAIVHGCRLCKEANDRMNEAAKADEEEGE